MLREFFGPQGSTRWVIENLSESLARYRHYDLDIRDRAAIRELLKTERPDFIIHTAGQPSHDKAASIPYEDFDVNAVGTLNLLVAARDYCRDSPFCFTSTNKVYGDRPNQFPLIELEKRYDNDMTTRTNATVSMKACRSMAAYTPYLALPRWRPMYRCEAIEGMHPLISPHFNLTVEMPLKAIVRGYSYTVIPINWTNRASGISKLKIKEMGSRYLFIVLYLWLEKVLARGDYRRSEAELPSLKSDTEHV